MRRQDPRSFLENVLTDSDLSPEVRSRLLDLAEEKAGARRVAALIEALTEPDADE